MLVDLAGSEKLENFNSAQSGKKGKLRVWEINF